LPKVIYTTGITGFIGRNLLIELLSSYDFVINFGRDNKMSVYNDSNVKHLDFSLDFLKNYPAHILVHLATYYNPSPRNIADEENLIQSNFYFGKNLCKNLSKIGPIKIIGISSYTQLLPFKDQSLYARSKSDFNKWANNHFEFLEVFLFDTFGSNDYRDKVVDAFIKKAIVGEDIHIPNDTLTINLTNVYEINQSIINLLNLNKGQYCIKSPHNVSLKDLAEIIIKVSNSPSSICNKNLPDLNTNDNIKLPLNIYKKCMSLTFSDQIYYRYNELN
jgi:nucleoside-diphosphate-sugar epimerase